MSDKLTVFLWICFAIINIVAYILMGVDKGIAVANGKTKKDRRRIPEKVLFAAAIFFGALGGTLGMYSFRHKTKHWYFAIFFPLLAVIQLAAIAYFKFFA